MTDQTDQELANLIYQAVESLNSLVDRAFTANIEVEITTHVIEYVAAPKQTKLAAAVRKSFPYHPK